MNKFGRIFNISIFGESHNKGVGILIDGVPAGIPLKEDDFLYDLGRRKGGKKGTTPRIEDDLPEIISGVFNEFTTGAPILILFKNQNTKSKDYSHVIAQPRPSHADFAAFKKYGGFNDYRGGGHFSGRITLGLVSAGVIAKKIIKDISISSKIISIGGEQNFDNIIDITLKENDSVGGIIECYADNIPIGLGEPFFDSIESIISHLAFSVPAVKGIEFGKGFEFGNMKGSFANDCIIDENGTTAANNNGGITGGISNGNQLVFRVAVKPTPSIKAVQKSFNFEKGKVTDFEIKGRHDCCIALRIPVIIEAVTAVALADLTLIQHSLRRK